MTVILKAIAHVPKDSVFDLTRGGEKSWELYQKGIRKLEDVPQDFPLNNTQQLQISCHKTGESYIDTEGIRDFLDTLSAPVSGF